jgi:hypothetical protein
MRLKHFPMSLGFILDFFQLTVTNHANKVENQWVILYRDVCQTAFHNMLTCLCVAPEGDMEL